MAQPETNTPNTDAAYRQANIDLSDFTKWLLGKGETTMQIIIDAIERASVKTERLDNLYTVNKRNIQLIQMQRLKFDKNGREMDPKLFRGVMLETAKRILVILNAYGERVAELCPPLAVEVFENFKGFQKVIDTLPEDFEKLPECLQR